MLRRTIEARPCAIGSGTSTKSCLRAVTLHYVQLNVTVAHAQLPLRLAVAAFLRTPMDDGTCPLLTEMAVVAIPDEIRKSSLVLTSGQALFPV